MNRKNLLHLFVLIAFLIPLQAVTAQDTAADADPEAAADTAAQAEAEKNVASVNGVAISENSLNREIQIAYQEMMSRGQYPDSAMIEQMSMNSLDTLISRELLFQAAVEKGYVADEAEVEQYINDLSMNYGGLEALEAMLVQSGTDMEQLRTDTKRYYVVRDFVIAEFQAGIEIPESEKEDFYNNNPDYFIQEETFQASHILLLIDEDASEEEVQAVKEKITGIRERIVNGEDFAEMAKEFSQGPSNVRGGELGVFRKGDMVPPFEQAVLQLEVGELSQPVRTQFGYHIILLTDRTEETTASYEDVQESIEYYLNNEKLNNKVRTFTAELKENAEIQIF